ncbi:hypothetical protein TCDM_08195 [Trypanosoma cruzi Dm28c]|uniref:Uncharacterized protein n=1 Tax=Trypanosoma cruzi Dm28c TaxID=1416333 RepID=V5B899_TRYCR|nr:hypothetical protein TCDM_08195 [Trypanosoma cruzi Dm28c]
MAEDGDDQKSHARRPSLQFLLWLLLPIQICAPLAFNPPSFCLFVFNRWICHSSHRHSLSLVLYIYIYSSPSLGQMKELRPLSGARGCRDGGGSCRPSRGTAGGYRRGSGGDISRGCRISAFQGTIAPVFRLQETWGPDSTAAQQTASKSAHAAAEAAAVVEHRTCHHHHPPRQAGAVPRDTRQRAATGQTARVPPRQSRTAHTAVRRNRHGNPLRLLPCDSRHHHLCDNRHLHLRGNRRHHRLGPSFRTALVEPPDSLGARDRPSRELSSMDQRRLRRSTHRLVVRHVQYVLSKKIQCHAVKRKHRKGGKKKKTDFSDLAAIRKKKYIRSALAEAS